jgi:Ca2+-binding EF-hand superfamily protein
MAKKKKKNKKDKKKDIAPRTDRIAAGKKAGLSEDDSLRAMGLSHVQIEMWREVFQVWDKEKRGYIDRKALTDMLKDEFQFEFDDDADCDNCFNTFTFHNSTERISFGYFAAWLHGTMYGEDGKEAKAPMTSAFNMMCMDGGKSKKMRWNEFSEAMTHLGETGSTGEDEDADHRREQGYVSFMEKNEARSDWVKSMQTKADALGEARAKKKKGGKKKKKAAPKVKIPATDPRYKKYFRLLKMHMPAEQIKMKMAAMNPELDPDVLDSPPP